MKEQKPLRLGPGEQEQARSGPTTEQNGTRDQVQQAPSERSADIKALRPGPAMHNELHTRNKSRGRLGRDVQNKLGRTLQAYFDDVLKEGVPDRFKELLQHFDERKDKGSDG